MEKKRRDYIKDKIDGSGLTPTELIFCQEYFSCKFNASEAYRKAGFTATRADIQAARLLKKEPVIKKIRELWEEMMGPVAGVANDVMSEIAHIAFSDIGDFVEWGGKGPTRIVDSNEIDKEKRRAVRKVEITEKILPGDQETIERNIKLELYDKTKMLDLLAKKCKVMNDEIKTTQYNINIDGKTIQNKSTAEIQRMYQGILDSPIGGKSV